MPALGSIADQSQPTNQNVGEDTVAQNNQFMTQLQMEQAQSLAKSLLGAGIDTSPTYSPWGAVGRVALSLAGALGQQKLGQESQRQMQDEADKTEEKLKVLTPTGTPGTSPGVTVPASPGTTPANLSLGSSVVPMEAAKAAISGNESGGNYQAKGPVINHGSYAGDRAYGKYQVMGKDLPDRLAAAGLPSMTAEQFLANPKAQEAQFEHEFGHLQNKYGNFNDAASVWFSGRPMARAGNASDGYMTVPSYINKANRTLASAMGPGAQAGAQAGAPSPALALQAPGQQPAGPLSGPVNAPVTTNPASPYSNGGGPPVYHPSSFQKDANGNFQPKPTPSGTHMIVPDPRNPSIQRAVPMNAMNPTPMAGQGALPQQGVPGYPGVATMPRPARTTSVTGPPLPPQTFGGPQPINAPPPQAAQSPAATPAAETGDNAPVPGNYVPGSLPPDKVAAAQHLVHSMLLNPKTHDQGVALSEKLLPQTKNFDNGTVGVGNDLTGYQIIGRWNVAKVGQVSAGVGPLTGHAPITAPGSNVSVPGVDQVTKMFSGTPGEKTTQEGRRAAHSALPWEDFMNWLQGKSEDKPAQ